MRHRVCIVKPPVPEDGNAAWRHLDTLLERRGDESGLPPDPLFHALSDRVGAMVQQALWSPGCAVTVLDLPADGTGTWMPMLIETAHALGLVVFDESQGMVHRPAPLPPRYFVRNETVPVKIALAGIREGFTRAQAVRMLAPLFRRTEAEIGRLLALPRPVVKSGLSREEASRYVDALERCGCHCVLLEEEGASPAEQCRAMAEAGDSQAQFDLGCMLFEGEGRGREQALQWWRKAAEQEHAAAQANIAWLYHDGGTVPRNLGEAVMWARRAADLGHVGAQVFLGERHEKGEGVPQDLRHAAHWYETAAAQGDAEALFRLGVLDARAGNDVQALLWFRKAAALGHAPAQYHAAVMLERGRGVPADPACAARWYRRAAMQGHAPAQYNLAVMYAEGRGVPQDFSEAAEWYRPAAEQGHANAQFNLALAYRNGEGVPRNDAEAAHWFSLCAERGDAEAQFQLGLQLGGGLGVPPDREKAHELLARAAAQGHEGARAYMANAGSGSRTSYAPRHVATVSWR